MHCQSEQRIYKITAPVRKDKGGNFVTMIDNFLLCEELTNYQLKLLSLIQYLRKELRGAKQTAHKNGEPLITLQYGYIIALFGGSNSTVKRALDNLYSIGLITQINSKYGECSTYQYNPSIYKSLIKKVKKRNCTLITGRQKQHREVSAETVLKYMTGKAIAKTKK